MSRLYSTAEVAEMWKISESTVKRLADGGALQCVRTPGGHRRFDFEALSAFRKRFKEIVGDPVPQLMENGPLEQPLGRPRHERARKLHLEGEEADKLRDAYFEIALRGDEAEATVFFEKVRALGYSALEVKEQIASPVLIRIGELWRRGEMSVCKEHQASQATIRASARLHLRTVQALKPGKLALCGGVEGDFHSIALQWIGESLETEGWRVVQLGPNTPFFSFAEAVAEHRPRVMCVSATLLHNLEHLRRDFAECRKTVLEHGTRVAVGGPAFSNPEIRGQFPHEFHGERISDLLDYLKRGFGD